MTDIIKKFREDFYIPCESTCASQQLGKCDCNTPKTVKNLEDFLTEALIQERKAIKRKVTKLEAEMVDGAGWTRMHELVLDILEELKSK